jgi:hypothetical protein
MMLINANESLFVMEITKDTTKMVQLLRPTYV